MVDSNSGRDVHSCGIDSSTPCASVGYVTSSVADSGDIVLLQGNFIIERPIAIMKDVEIKGMMEGIPSVIDCQGLPISGISISPDLTVKLQNLEVRNCRPMDTGAIQAFESEVHLESVFLRNNSRLNGQGAGAVFMGGSGTVLSSTFEDNLAMEGGAAISCVDCSLFMEASKVQNNKAPKGEGSIHLSGKTKLTGKNVVISGNTALFGAGLSVKGESLVELDSVDFLQNVGNDLDSGCGHIMLEGSTTEDSLSLTASIVGCNFITPQGMNALLEEEMVDYSVCLANTKTEIVQSNFEGVGINCFNGEFLVDDSVFLSGNGGEKREMTIPIDCLGCSGMMGEETVCTPELEEGENIDYDEEEMEEEEEEEKEEEELAEEFEH